MGKKEPVKCVLCGYIISKYFSNVVVRACWDCKVLYCRTCGSNALKKGKCKFCGKITDKIKRPSENPFISAPMSGTTSTIPTKKCGSSLEANVKINRTTQSRPPEILKPEKVVQIQEQPKEYQGEFKQSGVLCLQCRVVAPFRSKRCPTCNNKLKVNPGTIVYFNGKIEAVECPKCRAYTDYKSPKCDHCKKKLKI